MKVEFLDIICPKKDFGLILGLKTWRDQLQIVVWESNNPKILIYCIFNHN